MTIEEAIKHCEEKAKELREQAGFDTDNERYRMSESEKADCIECAKEHEQLAGWLKDYKRLLEMPKGDLISREALKKKLSDANYQTYTHEYGYAIPTECVMNAIDNAPTVKAYTDEELKKKYDEGGNDGYATCYDRYVRKNDEPFC